MPNATRFAEIVESDDAIEFHRGIPGYEPSPLLPLPKLAQLAGISRLYVKDESRRYGIQSFKGLGASYSIHRIVCELGIIDLPDAFILCAATDGNHGRAVAWFARLLKLKAVIYMPEDSAASRINRIMEEGAEVVLIPGTYDDCVVRCNDDASRYGWQFVSDTSFPGDKERPLDVIIGYTTLFKELDEQCKEPFDYVIVPVGVGGVAAAASLYFYYYKKSTVKLITVEPLSANCMMESLINGKPSFSSGKQDSLMAGLNCGFPSLYSWEILKETIHLSIAIPDEYVISAMRAYHDEGIISGESGAGALAGLLAIMDHPDIADKLGICNSSVLLLNTEGNTDPLNFSSIIGS